VSLGGAIPIAILMKSQFFAISCVAAHQGLDHDIYKVFGLRNKLVHHFVSPQLFDWFVEQNGLIHHHLIPYKLITFTIIRNGVIITKFDK
jgi:hypothetical protein